MMERAVLVGLLVDLGLVAACAGSAPPAPPASTVPSSSASLDGAPRAVSSRPPREDAWAHVTRSPWPALGAPDPILGPACGRIDGALERVAGRLVSEDAAPDPERVDRLLRMAGEPHPHPRVFRTAGPDRALLVERLAKRLGESRHPTTRCGLAERTRDGQISLVVVTVDALADLDELPSRARTGSWLSLEASLDPSMTRATVFVLGPRGAPRTVPTSFDPATHRARARFALDQPGPFIVQVLGQGADGPSSLLDVRVFADVEPTEEDAAIVAAPGEDAVGPEGNPADDRAALVRMTVALRAAESLPGLRRNAVLETIAQAYAERSASARRVAHDLGDGEGGPVSRLSRESFQASIVGENVARARSLTLAHRALHASPSHRGNLLHPRYTDIGVGVARGPDGFVYVAELFARVP